MWYFTQMLKLSPVAQADPVWGPRWRGMKKTVRLRSMPVLLSSSPGRPCSARGRPVRPGRGPHGG